MKDGLVIQSGMYNELLASCSDFAALVAAHHSSMGARLPCPKHLSSQPIKSDNGNGETTVVAPSKKAGSSKLIQEEETESGRVSWRVYKLYVTQAWGWWGFLAFLAVSLLSEGSSMASNYWLSYETSGGTIFDTSIFLTVYVLIVAATILFEMISTLVVTFSGLKSAQAFFNKMFNSILRAPMSFFDTTPSGRILSRVYILYPTIYRFT
jgi:ATP-binding cassette, subfamily C (CFTR/MRP), member 1